MIATEAQRHRDGRFDGWAGEAGLTDGHTDPRQTSLKHRRADSFPRVGASVGGATRRPSNRRSLRAPAITFLCVSASLWLVFRVGLGAAFPQPQKYVSDGAEVIAGPTRQAINATLRSLETDTTVEVAVVTVQSLDGMTVEDYANRLFKEWGIGKKGADNGVLVLVAPSERTMRVEVGYGLEPILPDGLAGEVIRTRFTPAFKGGDYSGGINAGVERIAEIIRARHTVSPAERKALAAAAEDRPPALLTIPFFGVFIGVGGFMLGAGFASKTFFPLMFGGLFGGLPFLMTLVPFFNAWPTVQLAIALVAGVLGYKRGGSAFVVTETSARRHRSRFGGSGWTWGVDSSGSGGSSGSSSSSSSGGSYGGGSSGGGGASGSW